jgi:hypothetical protein
VAPAPLTPAERDIAATKRSYLFIRGSSVVAWLVLLGALGTPTILKHHTGGAADAFWVVAAVTGLALVAWLAFLGGLRRRDLSRIERPAPRYDPRSR